jgi:hypothetical protein
MTLKEGPFFGAMIITLGVGYLVFHQTEDITKAVVIGVAVGVADYFLLGLFGRKPK